MLILQIDLLCYLWGFYRYIKKSPFSPLKFENSWELRCKRQINGCQGVSFIADNQWKRIWFNILNQKHLLMFCSKIRQHTYGVTGRAGKVRFSPPGSKWSRWAGRQRTEPCGAEPGWLSSKPSFLLWEEVSRLGESLEREPESVTCGNLTQGKNPPNLVIDFPIIFFFVFISFSFLFSWKIS